MKLFNGKYLIKKQDDLNWIIQRLTQPNPNHHFSKDATPTYKTIGYYGNLSQLLRALLDIELLDSEVNTLQDIKDHLSRIENTLKIATEGR